MGCQWFVGLSHAQVVSDASYLWIMSRLVYTRARASSDLLLGDDSRSLLNAHTQVSQKHPLQAQANLKSESLVLPNHPSYYCDANCFEISPYREIQALLEMEVPNRSMMHPCSVYSACWANSLIGCWGCGTSIKASFPTLAFIRSSPVETGFLPGKT